jgi:stage II sporulation protein D
VTRAARIRAHRRLLPVGLALALAACAGGPPRHRSGPEPARTSQAPVPAESAPIPAPHPEDLAAAEDDLLVRIGLHWDETRETFETLREWTIEVDRGSPVRRAGGVLRARADGAIVRLESAGGAVLAANAQAVRLSPGEGSLSTVGERKVRGSFELSARNDSLFVVEILPLEEYLRGVVPAEIGRLPDEARAACEAQAIAARTYTMNKIGQYASLPFDLFASVQDQVYEGFEGEDPVANAAIAATKGLVLSAGDDLVDTYYSAACGGSRSDIAVVWPHKPPTKCLAGGPDGAKGSEWCRQSRHFRWREEWSGAKVAELVRRHAAEEGVAQGDPPSGALTEIRVEKDDASGRIRAIEYRWNGGSARVPGDRNRWVLRRADGTILRSTYVSIEVERRSGSVSRVVAEGRGNGHGVGMCQTGAIARARAGQDVRQILEAYYPGSRVRAWTKRDLSQETRLGAVRPDSPLAGPESAMLSSRAFDFGGEDPPAGS